MTSSDTKSAATPAPAIPPVRVAAVQMVSAPDVERNLREAAHRVAEAAEAGAQLVLLPEYFCYMGQHDTDKLALRETPGCGPIQDFLAETARRHGVWLIGGTLPLAAPEAERVLNTTLVFGPDGAVAARYDKIHLFNFAPGLSSPGEAVEPIPGVPQSGHDVADLVETLVHRGDHQGAGDADRVDQFAQVPDAFGCGEQADADDLVGAAVDQELHCSAQ